MISKYADRYSLIGLVVVLMLAVVFIVITGLDKETIFQKLASQPFSEKWNLAESPIQMTFPAGGKGLVDLRYLKRCQDRGSEFCDKTYMFEYDTTPSEWRVILIPSPDKVVPNQYVQIFVMIRAVNERLSDVSFEVWHTEPINPSTYTFWHTGELSGVSHAKNILSALRPQDVQAMFTWIDDEMHQYRSYMDGLIHKLRNAGYSNNDPNLNEATSLDSGVTVLILDPENRVVAAVNNEIAPFGTHIEASPVFVMRLLNKAMGYEDNLELDDVEVRYGEDTKKIAGFGSPLLTAQGVGEAWAVSDLPALEARELQKGITQFVGRYDFAGVAKAAMRAVFEVLPRDEMWKAVGDPHWRNWKNYEEYMSPRGIALRNGSGIDEGDAARWIRDTYYWEYEKAGMWPPP